MKHKKESERKGSSNIKNKIYRFGANLRSAKSVKQSESADEFSLQRLQGGNAKKYFSIFLI